jgi:hypothetical protein
VYGDSRAVDVRPGHIVVGTRLVLLLFLVVQGFDGLFTYVAVDALGVTAEGNRLLAALMTGLGTLPTLIAAKVTAAAGGMLLYVRGWHRVLAVVTAIYALLAIGPWLLVYVSWGRF